jgi:hypothetical protein
MDNARTKASLKVKALLAKTAAQGCTEHEATTAAAMASQLMTKHGLSRSDVSSIVSDELRPQAAPTKTDGGFTVKTPLLKMNLALLAWAIEATQSNVPPKETSALNRFANAVTKWVSGSDRKAATERVVRYWGNLPPYLQHKVANAAAEAKCVAELQAIVGTLPRAEQQ